LQAIDLTPLADLPAAYLSAGQRRRLSLARLVAVPRAIWLLDEPTTALDAASQNNLAGLMRRHLTSGGMIVAAAHGAIGLERARELKMDEQ
jgi:heme exporter protein A